MPFFLVCFHTKNLSGIPSVSNSLDPDQDLQNVGCPKEVSH